MTTDTPTPQEEFKDLAIEAKPMQDRITEISYRQVELAHEMAIEIFRNAFPLAQVTHVKAFGVIKPSDMGKSAHEAVLALRERQMTPREIQVDSSRFVITLLE